MIDYVLNFQWNGLLGICLYWMPMLFCAVFYTVRTVQNYMKDKAERERLGNTLYWPTDRIGDLLGRAVVSITPIANIWAAMFDLSPKVFSSLFKWLGAVFDAPLVPDSEEAKLRRKSVG